MERQNTVLVVDDDPFALRSMVEVLGGESYQVVTAASGSEALDLLKQDSFDLVLTDLKMPEVDGLEVLRQAREIAPQAVVLILTGYAALESAVEALREGAYDYLLKPCSGDELKLKIERGLERVRLAEERQQAVDEIRQRTAQLEALRQVGLEITTQLDLDALLHSIASRAIELIGGISGGLYLYQPERDVLEWSMAVGPHLAPIGTILHRGEGLSGRVWETGTPRIVDDYQAWEKRAAVYEGYPFRAVVGVPVRWGEEFLGVLNVLANPPRTFSPADTELLGLFATQAAIAIRNARLYEETRQRALEQETVSRIAYALNTPDVRDAYPVLVEGLQDLTSCEVVNLIAMDEAGEQSIMTVLESPFPIPGEGEVMPLSATAAAEDLEAGRPHLIGDLSTEAHFPLEQALYQAGLRSWVTLPLLVGGEVFGGLSLGGSDTGLFREDQLPVLRQIADAVALALQNSFIFLAEQERRHVAETLRQASTVLSSTLELDEVLGLILQQLRQVIPYDSASVQQLQDKHLKIVACQGFEEPDKVVGLVFPLDPKFPNYRVVTTKAPLAIKDVTQDYPHFQDEADAYESGRIRSWLGVPLMVKDEVVGMIAVDRAEVNPYTTEDAQLAMAFANQAAIAIENARLFGKARQRVAELETLRHTSLQLTSSLDLPAVLDSIAESALSLVGATDCHIYLYNEASETFTFGTALWEDGRREAAVKTPRRDGLTATVARESRVIVINDAPHHPLYTTPEAQKWDVQAIAGFPLKRAGQVLGVFTIVFTEPHTFSEEELRVLGLLADQAAIAIENARLYEETKRRAEEMTALHETALDITIQLEMQRVLNAIITRACDLLGATGGLVHLYDPAREKLVAVTSHNLERDYTGLTLEAGEGVAGKVLQTGQPLIIDDHCTWAGKSPQVGDAYARSMLGVPLRWREQVIGVLDIVDNVRVEAFDERDLGLLTLFANQAAIAIENARLYEETGRRAEELASLYEIALATSATLEIDELLKRIYEQVSQLVSFDAFWVALVDKERGELRFEITMEEGKPLPKRTRKLEARGSLAGWVAHTRKPFLIRDWDREEDALPVVTHQVGKPVRSWLGIPLLFRDRVVGVMSVQSFEPHAFDEEDQRLLTVLANQAAIAIENARLFEETERLKTFNESVVQGIAEAILIEDAQGILTFANPAAEELSGYTCEELIGRHWMTIVPGDEIEKVRQELAKRPRAIDGRYETVLLSREGPVIPVIVSAQPLFEEGEFIGVLSAFTDIRERVRREREIEERRLYLEGVLGAAPDAVVTTDAHHRVVEWNAGAERLFGYSREEAVGQDLDHLVTSPDVFEEAVGFTQAAMDGRAVPPTETVRYRKDGSPVDVLLAGSPILVGGELIGVVAVYTDITARVRMEETLRALALLDELTGLYNRRGFFTLAEQQLKTADRAKRKMLLLFADFDDLKWINDTLGHPEGDRALIEVANAFRETFRESDIMARMGGDEFVVLAIETDGSPAEVLATRLQDNLGARNARGDRRYRLSLSVGLARYDPEHPCSIDELLVRADRSMYERKRGNQKY